MFILPYVYHTRHLPDLTIHIFSLLTVGGRRLWMEEDHLDLINDILQPNGFHPIDCTPYKDVMLCSLDPSQVNWSDYYHWEEIEDASEVFCWRSFYLVSPLLSLPRTEGLEPYSYQELFHQLLFLHSSKDTSSTTGYFVNHRTLRQP